MLSALMEKADNMHKQMGKISREMKQKQKERLEIKKQCN